MKKLYLSRLKSNSDSGIDYKKYKNVSNGEIGGVGKPKTYFYGLVFSESYDTLVEYITPKNKTTGEEFDPFWRYSPPEEVWCTEDVFDKLVFENDLLFAESFKIMPFDFYKQL